MKKLLAKIIGSVLVAAGLVVAGCSGFTNTIKLSPKKAVVNGNVFNRISAVNELSDGDEIIFVNQDETYACGTTQNTNNRTPVPITTNEHSYTYSSTDNVQVFVVKISSSNYGFHTGSGYIYSASSSANYLKTNSTESSTNPSGTSAWGLSVSSNVFSITNKTNTNYYLAFNGTSYFSQYKTGQSKPFIYKKAAPKTPSSLALSGDYPTSFYQNDSFSHEGMTVTVTYANGAGTANVTASATFTGYNMSNVGNQTVTVSYTENATTVSTTYGITVSSPRTMLSIELRGEIAKKDYYVGDFWELAGLDIQVNWSVGNPTYVDLEDADVVYELTPDTATDDSVTSFDIEVLYENFDETFTVDGLTVTVHPFADVFDSTTLPAGAVGSGSSTWGAWTEFTDYTYSLSVANGAKYQVKLMGPGSEGSIGRINNSANGGFYTSKAPLGVRIKTIAFSSITANKNVSVYLQNEAYEGLPITDDYITTLTSDNLSYTVEGNYSCFAIRGRTNSNDIGSLTITYEQLAPSMNASPSSFSLYTGGTQNVEISVANFALAPTLGCSVQSGNSSIYSASVGSVNGLNKATAIIVASNVPGDAVVRVYDSAHQDLYYVDISVTVDSIVGVIEDTISTSATLSYHYSRSGAVVDTLNKELTGISGNSYSDWSEKTVNSEAIYAGNSYGDSEFIQLRSTNNSGIVSTSSGGCAKKISVVWNSGTANGRTLDIYGKDSAYASASELYNNETKGTKIGSITYGIGSILYIEDDYEYIGLRSSDSALILESISIQWGDYSYSYSNTAMRFGGFISNTLWDALDAESSIQGYGVLISTEEEINTNPVKNYIGTALSASENPSASLKENIVDFYMPLSQQHATPSSTNAEKTSESGDYYIWNLYQGISSDNDDLIDDVYVAAAYIKTSGGYVFMGEQRFSAKTLAVDYLTNRECTRETAGGSLYNLAHLS